MDLILTRNEFSLGNSCVRRIPDFHVFIDSSKSESEVNIVRNASSNVHLSLKFEN